MSEAEKNISSIERGVETIRGFVKTLPATPGVYRMISAKGEVLYVGKAKALKKRVSNYTHINKQPIRLQRMISLTREMEFVSTRTEVEALLLESNLIKKLKPRFNILLRDDKSFPYILMTAEHDFPQVVKHRGARKRKGEYFGPFAGAGDVNRTIITLQRVFMLRNCSDHYFTNRQRPCLQYHIKRCTAPCVGKVSKCDYANQVSDAQDFLRGKSQNIQQRLAQAMQEASDAMKFEVAAQYRDRIKALTFVQGHQDINVANVKDADVLGIYQDGGQACIQVFFFRSGQNYGNRSYFPRHDADKTLEQILGAFVAQFYENKSPAREVIISHDVQELELLEEALTCRSDHKVEILRPQRGTRARLVSFVVDNAREALERYQAQQASQVKLLQGVADLFDMDEPPKRIEVYDNSHISGTNMVGGMVVAGVEGFRKSAYRKFNIKKAAAADDYAMMREVMERRFKRALTDNVDRDGDEWPDLLLIDGGAGQLSACKGALEDLGVWSQLTVVGISKGPERNAGREKFLMEGRDAFQLPVNDPVLHYLQRLRDEVHRFAIGAHRTRRTKQITSSPLDGVAGIGAKRKKALLHHFGSAKAVSGAALEDLEKVEGISRAIAQKIYDHFH